MSLATRPAPLLDAWNRPFWDACSEGRLMFQRCRVTHRSFFPPAPVSPFTGRPDWDWHASAGTGTLWSFVVFHQSYFPGLADELPYTVAMVRLDDGPMLMSNLDGVHADAVRIGMRLQVRFPGGPDGVLLPLFGPAG